MRTHAKEETEPAAGTRRAPLVCSVVLNYENWAETQDCLASLAGIDFPSHRVLLVDNGSRSGPPPGLAEARPEIEVLCESRNLGYAGGNNRGIARAIDLGAEYIWILNNDTRPEAGSLRALLQTCESDPKVGAAGSVLLEEAGGIQAWGGGRISFLTGLPRHQRREGARLDYLCGASLFLRREALDDVGLFDPGFFLYWEDADLCLRLKAAGWKLAVSADARVVHRSSSSAVFRSRFYDYHFTASSVRFYRKHARAWLLPVLVSVGGRIVNRSLAGRPKNAWSVWRGLLDALRGRIETA